MDIRPPFVLSEPETDFEPAAADTEPASEVVDFYEYMPAAAIPAVLERPRPAEPELDGPTPAYLQALRTEGAVAAFIVAGSTAIIGGLAVAGYGVLAVSPWSLVDAAVFLLLAIGILRSNRLAAAAALGLFVSETVAVFAVADLNLQTVGAISVIIRALIMRSLYRGLLGTLGQARRRTAVLLTATAVILGFGAGFVLSSVR
jgi:hypothetical protein